MMEKSAQPFITVDLPSRTKLWCMYAPAERADILPPILLYPNMHSVGEVKLEKRKKTADYATVNI
jgi:hypothetical protein